MPMIEVFSNGAPTGKAVEVPEGFHMVDKKAAKESAQVRADESIKKAMQVKE